jgi:hypothetical protein
MCVFVFVFAVCWCFAETRIGGRVRRSSQTSLFGRCRLVGYVSVIAVVGQGSYPDATSLEVLFK